jgi:hypothetical protein
MQNLHNFTRGAALNDYVMGKQLAPLTDEQIRATAPSVFADAPHESRSARYAYISTAQLLASLRAEGFEPVSAQQSVARIPGRAPFTKHMLKFTHADATAATRVGDAVAQICLKNAHDGSSAYEISLGLYRFLCSNGLMVCDGTFSEIRVPHVGDVRGRVIEGSYQVIEAAGGITERVDAWRGVALTHQEQEAFARQAIALRWPAEEGEAPHIEPAQALTVRRDSDRGDDLWSTFNRVQENLIKGGQRYVRPGHRTVEGRYVPMRRLRTREVKGIDQNTGLNRALWRLAEEMRTLKAAA